MPEGAEQRIPFGGSKRRQHVGLHLRQARGALAEGDAPKPAAVQHVEFECPFCMEMVKVSADLAEIVSDPDFKRLLANVGSYSRAMTPEQVLTFVQREQDTWLPVLQKISEH